MKDFPFLYVAVFAGSCALTLILTPVFRKIAELTNFMDVPADNHKGHKKSTPLLGGLAMFTAWLISLGAGITVVFRGWFSQTLHLSTEHLQGIGFASSELISLVIGAALAVMLGLVDDKIALSAKVKFGGQFIIALIAVFCGGVRFNLFPEYQILSTVFTLFWIMLLMNSINFFDNMDGLAAGVIAIALGIFAVIAGLNGQFFITAISALSCGVCCGFWFYNMAPAKIFMGDSGSHFLGFLAAVTAAEVSFFDISYSHSRFPVLIPLIVLALPLFDTAMVVMIRTLNKKPFWIGDHNHISHRFVRMGLSRPVAVLLVHLLSLSIGITALPIFWGDFRTAATLVFQAFLQLTVITILQFALAKKE